jgi:uncharacterized protein
MNPQLTAKQPRVEVVDALRGFAVMAILLVHSVEHFNFYIYPTDQPDWLAWLDRSVFCGVFALMAGKSYAIFALLFGFTFYVQWSNQRRQGRDFGYRFLWRLLLLVGFASLNSVFFMAGDVLLLFAAVGIILFLVRNCSDKVVLGLAVLFLLQPVEWFHYAAGAIAPAYRAPDLGVGALFGEAIAYTQQGDFLHFVRNNLLTGQKASLFWAIDAGRYIQTAGLFLLGFYFGRRQLFLGGERNMRRWFALLVASAVLYAPLNQLSELVTGDSALQPTLGTVLDMWQKLAFTFVLVSSFVLLYHRFEGFRRRVADLRTYGRMSLSNYIGQSILGALVYYPFGLGLATRCGQTVSLLIGIAMLVLQIACCKWWLKRHRQGPLEWIWHKWTWIGSSAK